MQTTQGPPTVCIIGPDWEITARFRSELIQDMLAEGWSITVAAGGATGPERASLEAMGVRCQPLEWSRNALNPLRDLASLMILWRLLRREKPSAVLAFTVKPATFGLIGAALAGVPRRVAMITGAGYALMEGRELKRRVVRAVVLRLYRLALGHSHAVIFQNPDDQAEFGRLRLLPAAIELVRTNGSGVDLARFRATPMPEGPIRFVMVARLLSEKGVREFVDAARMVRASDPTARFDLVGPLDTNPAAISGAEVQGWVQEGVVTYHGLQQRVDRFLRSAHVFVLPSYREGTPRSALEALATGRPVLACDVPGSREVVNPGVTGQLVEVRNASAVAEGMRWFIARQAELPKMGAAAAADARARFDVRAVNHIVMKTLEPRPT